MTHCPKNGKKILYLLDLFPKLSETFVTNELEALVKNDIPIEIWACSPSEDKIIDDDIKGLLPYTKYFLDEIPSKYEKLKAILFLILRNPVRFISAHRIIKKLNSRPSKHQLRRCYVYAKDCIEAEISHIHTHFATKAAEYAMFINLLSGIPSSVTCHAYDIFLPNPSLADILERSEFAVTISEYNKRFLTERFPALKIPLHVIHCGIDPRRIQVKDTTTSLHQKKIRIFSVGRLVEKKGMTYLIEACRRLVNDGCRIDCEIAGDGPLYTELEEQITHSGIEKCVRLLGAVSPAAVWLKLSACDIFSLPVVIAQNGDMDGIPVSLMEAVAVGKPVVATSVSGLPELLEDVGWLCREKRPEEIVEAVYQIVNEEKSSLENRLRCGVERIQNEFNQQHEAKKLIKLFFK